MPARLMAKGLKPRVIISENDGTWTLRAETSLRTKSVTFTPDVEYEEKTADGRDIKVDFYLTIIFSISDFSEHFLRQSSTSTTARGNIPCETNMEKSPRPLVSLMTKVNNNL